MMGNGIDFEEEETLLQSIGREMGVFVDWIPKCHCELAGEGIKYSWGCAKNFDNRVSLKRKEGKENFRSVVQKSMSTDKVSTTKRIRHFSRWARQYIYIMCINKDLERSWWTTRWQDGCQSWQNNTWSRPHQPWGACQMIQNTLLCPRFRHNLLQGNRCRWFNTVAGNTMKLTSNKINEH